MKRSRGFASFGIVVVMAAALLTAHNAVRQSELKRLDVEGAKVQNGWVMDGTFDGTAAPPAQQHGALVTFVENLLSLGKTDENDCTRYSPAYPGLRIRSPNITSVAAEINSSHSVTFIGHSPEGVPFPLTGETRPWTGDSRKSEFYLRLPKVPEDCPYIDVVVRDRGKEQAVWHVAHLPRLYHCIPSSETASMAAILGGATLEGRAYWDTSKPHYRTGEAVANDSPISPDSIYSGRTPVQVDLRVRNPFEIIGNAYLGRQLNIASIREEWDSAPTEASMGNPTYQIEDAEVHDSLSEKRILAFAAPYPGAQHRVEIDGSVEGGATYIESVLFRQLALTHQNGPWRVSASTTTLKQRTTNGITVSILPGREGRAENRTQEQEPEDSLVLRVHTETSPTASKGSPLYGVDDSPPRVEVVSLAVGDELLSPEPIDTETGDAIFVVSRKFLQKHKMSDPGAFHPTVTLNEQVEFPSTPFHLVLPIRKGKPAVSWTNVQGPSAITP